MPAMPVEGGRATARINSESMRPYAQISVETPWSQGGLGLSKFGLGLVSLRNIGVLLFSRSHVAGSNTKGEVALGVYVTSERLRFEVRDTGQGIPQEDLPSMFKPFYQATNNQLIGQGVGLGLHISKQIVELLGGTIVLASELGQGSTFTFDIPRRDAEPANREVYSPQIVGYNGPRRKILIVDDEPLNRSMLRELLATVGFESGEASSPADALSLLNDSFDAVISDIRMPGYDGAYILPKS